MTRLASKLASKLEAPRGPVRDRVLSAALELFAEHGVSGTSLQMIADRVGVAKASVYYQFHTKEDIVSALMNPVFDDIARLVKIAEAVGSVAARRDVAVSGLVELAVRNRDLTAVFFGDPAVDELIRARNEFAAAIDGLDALLTGPAPDDETRVATSIITAGIYGTAINPHLADVPDEELHRLLLETTQRLMVALWPG
ncbi:TetR/AcrR family transcriptional regulator [Mycobacterium sp. 1274761.0]|uniref:TetR/AcrR family transcriptional regulator n=1 Tax=Mycobacterium sp. 1274761.0 TaxID=1834077 RepID=UPI0007FEC796|nr:TetR/AcrR family transcriptional regulator [Mycobacterium sp. 1274761.0]OBK71238.1 TetR family transcriptional regulator [Mycobacterium sp. 1274761.0]